MDSRSGRGGHSTSFLLPEPVEERRKRDQILLQIPIDGWKGGAQPSHLKELAGPAQE